MRSSCRIALVAAGSLLAMTNLATAALSISEDFQSSTVGLTPSSADFFHVNSPSSLKVIDSASTPADPFGGAGNRSLLLDDAHSSDDVQIGYGSGGGDTIVGPGVFESDFYVTKDDVNFPSVGIEFRIGSGAASGSIGIWLGHYGNTLLTANDFVAFDQPVAVNAPHRIVVNFNVTAGADTYSVKVDGVTMTKDGGATSVFPFYQNQPLIESFRITSGWSSNTTSRVYVDDVLLVPEPGSMGLVIGAMAMLRRRRAEVV